MGKLRRRQWVVPEAEPQVVVAGNPGPFTLDGTRTFLVGRRQVAVIDPGPDVKNHIRAVSHRLKQSHEIRILLTHGHSDHAGATAVLAEEVGSLVFASPALRRREFIPDAVHPLAEGDRVPTDQGDLRILEVPGHSRDHLAYYWPEAGALFAGDLVLGRGDTTWLGEYPGCVADYLSSLGKVRALDPRVLYPSHGPAIFDPPGVLARFEKHRLQRIEEVREARLAHPGADPTELARLVYGGEGREKFADAARESVEVTLHHLDEAGRSAEV